VRSCFLRPLTGSVDESISSNFMDYSSNPYAVCMPLRMKILGLPPGAFQTKPAQGRADLNYRITARSFEYESETYDEHESSVLQELAFPILPACSYPQSGHGFEPTLQCAGETRTQITAWRDSVGGETPHDGAATTKSANRGHSSSGRARS